MQLSPNLVTTPLVADRWSESSGIARLAGSILAASALVAGCAHVSVVLPFTPVPVVLSDLAVILVGLLLGPSAGAGALLLYLVEGAVGLPVFSPHGPGSIAQMVGPTGGFLLSYPLVAFIAGLLFRNLRHSVSRAPAAVLAGFAACVPLFLCGAGWLAVLLHLSPATALQLAVAPFAVASAVKVFVAAALVASLHRLRPASQS